MGGDAKQAEALTLFDEGRAAAAHGDHALAVTKLRAAAALVPSAASLAALGTSLSHLGFHSEAVVSFAAAVGLGDATVANCVRLAAAIAEAGDRLEGLRRLWDLRREAPDDPEVHLELLRMLSDPAALARIANRQQVIEEIRAALPELRIAASDSWLEGLGEVGRYISAWAATPADPRRLAPAFRFLDRLAEDPNREVADLLTAIVFPAFSHWSAPVEAARAMLGVRARRALEDAIALWGPPSDGDPPLQSENLVETLRFRLPGFCSPRESPTKTGIALGRYFASVIQVDASSVEIKQLGVMLSRMAEADDSDVRAAFADALEQVLRSGSPKVVQTVHQSLSGLARAALENLAGRDQLG